MHNIFFKESIAYGLGAIGKDVIFNLVAIGFMVQAVKVLGISPYLAGCIYALGRVFDALSDPFIGYLADVASKKKLGFSFFIFTGTVLSSLSAILLFIPFNFSPLVNIILVTFLFLVFTSTYSIIDVPFWGLIASFGSDTSVRDVMSSVPRAGALIGQHLFILASPFFISHDLFGNSYLTLAFISALFFCLCEVLMLKGIKDPLIDENTKNLTLKNTLSSLKANDALKNTALIMLLQQIIIAIASVTILNRLQDSSYQYLALISSALCQLIAFVSIPSLNRIFSCKTVFSASALLMALSTFILAFIVPNDPLSSTLFILLFCLFGVGSALSLVQTSVMTADSVDYGEFKTGFKLANLAFSFQTACAKLSFAINTFLTMSLMSSLYVIKGEYENLTKIELINEIPLISATLLALLMLVVYRKYCKLNSAFFKNTLSVLEKLKEKNQDELDSQDPVVVRYALQKNAICYQLDLNQEINKIEDIIHFLCLKLEKAGALYDVKLFEKDVLTRLANSPCGIAEGIAIPHAKSAQVLRPTIAVATKVKAFDCKSSDGRKCDLFFLIASPLDSDLHLNLLGRLSLMLNERGFADKLRQAGSADEIYERMIQTSISICSKPRRYSL